MCIKYCKQKDIYLNYYGYDICEKDWDRHCDNIINLKECFGIVMR